MPKCPAARLTPAQRAFLQQCQTHNRDQINWGGMAGAGGARFRMARRLAYAGLITLYDWTLTDAGRIAIGIIEPSEEEVTAAEIAFCKCTGLGNQIKRSDIRAALRAAAAIRAS